MQRLEPEPEHVLQVARLALRLFDDLADWHGLGQRERVLLEGAACLHDIGWTVARSGTRHHKESARLIREQRWRCFVPREVETLALVARYHRKTPPRPAHRAFARLSPLDQSRVATLAALLRVADALDRRHIQVVRDVRAAMNDERLAVRIDAPQAVTVEMDAGRRKSDLLRKLTGRVVAFEWTGSPAA